MKTSIINHQAVVLTEDTIPENTPFIMLNLLRFKTKAYYASEQDHAPCSGQEAYLSRYIPAFNKAAIAEDVADIQINFIGSVVGHLVSPTDEHWDIVALVEYPSFAAFRKISESRIYMEEAEHHRVAALEDWRLIATVKAAL
ncbi:hypothetical protein [Dyadobacter sp. NIV53]|uniref:hypothetical protein n=1 Tax=Dyadobacter sp. NIV53 TaxID=2861765 RepID=UPI001C86DF7C|nr:hypothetical protein [Dyadobacter sp. NIV53]